MISEVSLAGPAPFAGELNAIKTHANGGTYDTLIPIEPRYDGAALVIEGLFPDRASLAAVQAALASELAAHAWTHRREFVGLIDSGPAAEIARLSEKIGELPDNTYRHSATTG